MKLLIHLIGASCAGKTYLIEEYLDYIGYWDITQWYKERKIIWENKMNWDKYHLYNCQMIPDLKGCIKKSNKDIFVIESSGLNRTLNNWLSMSYSDDLLCNLDITEVVLQPPSDELLTDRACQRKDIEYMDVVRLKELFEQSSKSNPEYLLTQYEAGIYIGEWIDYYVEKIRNQNNKTI